GLLPLPALPLDAVAGREEAAALPDGRRLRDGHRLAGRGAAARAELREHLHHRLPLLPVAEPGPLPAARPQRAARPDGGAGDAGLHPGVHLRGHGPLGGDRRAGAVLLQHAARLGDHRHPDRALAQPRRGGDQPLDVPGEVRALAADRGPARLAGERHRHARAGAARVGRARGLPPDHARLGLPGRSRRFDAIAHRAFFERLRRTGVITQEGIEREIAARRPVSAEEQEALQLALRTLEQMYGSVALGFSSEDQLLGVLVIRDDRLREAYSTDEIEIFRGVATSIGITLQNSQVYERMKERDRLAALGQMAAG